MCILPSLLSREVMGGPGIIDVSIMTSAAALIKEEARQAIPPFGSGRFSANLV